MAQPDAYATLCSDCNNLVGYVQEAIELPTDGPFGALQMGSRCAARRRLVVLGRVVSAVLTTRAARLIADDDLV